MIPDQVDESPERSFHQEKNRGIHDDSVSDYDLDQLHLDWVRKWAIHQAQVSLEVKKGSWAKVRRLTVYQVQVDCDFLIHKPRLAAGNDLADVVE